ncbi:MAG: hypothetical protein P4M15_07905 [Alphaproteobacteria bacterium]|nr:hypothetical protein [Alphaproteobacteria bacterium]
MTQPKMKFLIAGLTAALMASIPAYAASTQGLDTLPGTNFMPFSLQGYQQMQLDAAGFSISPTSAASPTPTQAVVLGMNQINEEAVAVAGQTWSLTPTGAGTLYLQAPLANGPIVIGSSTSTATHLYVHGGIVTYQPVTRQFGGTPQILANGDDHTGGGLAVSDDGGFYDYNDGYITFNGNGLKVEGSYNGGVPTKGTLFINNTICLNGDCYTSWPAGGTGVVTFYHEGNGFSGSIGTHRFCAFSGETGSPEGGTNHLYLATSGGSGHGKKKAGSGPGSPGAYNWYLSLQEHQWWYTPWNYYEWHDPDFFVTCID